MADDFEYDPERALWKPGRRGFLSLLGCAVASAFLPSLPEPGPINFYLEPPQPASGWAFAANSLRKGDTFTIQGVFARPNVLQEFRVTSVVDDANGLTMRLAPVLDGMRRLTHARA